jgi:hypothetical protein
MNVSTEDRIRAATRAQAGLLREVRPLRLPKATGDATGNTASGPATASVRGASRTPLRLDGDPRPRRGRRWRTWGAPVAAAAVIIALAVALGMIKSSPNGGKVPPVTSAPKCTGPNANGASPAVPAAAADGVPRYYVSLSLCGVSKSQTALLVVDTFTGKTVATVTSPHGTTFRSISAAADDRTFAIFATPVSTDPHVAGWWYLLRLAPGTSSPARLTRLPVKPLANVNATALSGSGKELLVGLGLDERGTPWLGVYSVATGRLVRSWSSHGTPPFRIEGFGLGFFSGMTGAPQSSALTWIEGDRAIAFLAVTGGGTGTWRQLDIVAKGSDIAKNSRVIWSAAHTVCGGSWMRISADGKTVDCAANSNRQDGKTIRWTIRWLAYSVAARTPPLTVYQAIVPAPLTAGLGMNILWVSPAGTTMLIAWTLTDNHGAPIASSFGIASHGTFTPLKAPEVNEFLEIGPPAIAW